MSPTFNKVVRRLSVVLCSVLLLAACGGDDGSPQADATTTSSGNTSSDATTTTVAIDKAATLRIAFGADTTSAFDPHKARQAGDLMYQFLVFDRLIHQDDHGELVPGLATSWEWDAAGTTLTFQLRPGVQFQDGAVLDADAVKMCLDRALTLEGSPLANSFTNVESVEVVDPATVAIHTSQPDSTLTTTFAGAAGAIMSPASLTDPDLATKPVGAGRYQLVSYTPGVKAEFAAWDGYWDPDVVNAARIETSVITDTAARLNALRTGTVDVSLIDPGQTDEAEAAGIQVFGGPSLAADFLFLNKSRAHLDDVRVRQALSYAIDREAIVEGIYFGNGEAGSQYYPSGFVGHSERAESLYPYDPDKAKELLAEAGLDDGYTIDVLVLGIPSAVQVAEAIQEQMSQAGITMNITQADPSQVAVKYFVNKEADALITPGYLNIDPVQTAIAYHAPESVVGNPGGYTTPEWSKLISDAIAAVDPSERADAVDELMYQLAVDVGNVVIDSPYYPWAATDKVVNLTMPQGSVQRFESVGLRAD